MNRRLVRRIQRIEAHRRLGTVTADRMAEIRGALDALDASVPETEAVAEGLSEGDAIQDVLGLNPHVFHELQAACYRDSRRFVAAACGRRSGKSEVARRKVVRRAADPASRDHFYFIGCPTHQQARDIHWAPLKRVCRPFLAGAPRESDLTIRLYNGTEIRVGGLDKPQRAEGRALDGAMLDEYGDMKPEVWNDHLRPALSTRGRPGWAIFSGTPEPNHWRDLFRWAETQEDWGTYQWFSASVLPEAEVEAARAQMDEASFRREYEASWEGYGNRAYYAYGEHNVEALAYDKDADLILGFDFNVAPGVAVIGQQQRYRGARQDVFSQPFCALDEVWIKDSSNTVKVCREILSRWGSHPGRVLCYGDASGGARKTSATEGSDWDLIRKTLEPAYGRRLRFRVPKENPAVRARLNVTNTALRSAAEVTSVLIDPVCEHLVRDLEAVPLNPDGSINDKDKAQTHLSDAFGYVMWGLFPPRKATITQRSAFAG